MNIFSFDKTILYDGSQLRPHWIYENTDLLGDTIVSFRGGCSISLDKMVDLEDRQGKKTIYSEDMLHFIFESFHFSLREMVLWQHLFAAIVMETVAAKENKLSCVRQGNDIYIGEKKLSISVATISSISTLLHFGINISSKNTPVPTISLNDLEFDINLFAKKILSRLKEEYDIAQKALYKVKSV